MPTSRAQQKEATREHLFEVAIRLFEQRGYEAVNVDDIVRASKVARGTFYFHFPRKDDVLVEAIRRGEQRILERIAAAPADAPLRAVLGVTTLAFAEVWGDRRELLAHACTVALLRIAAEADVRDRDPLRLELARQVERAIAGGELRSVLPGRMLADIFLLDVFATLMAWTSAGEPPLSTVMPAVVELFLRGAEGFGSSI